MNNCFNSNSSKDAANLQGIFHSINPSTKLTSPSHLLFKLQTKTNEFINFPMNIQNMFVQIFPLFNLLDALMNLKTFPTNFSSKHSQTSFRKSFLYLFLGREVFLQLFLILQGSLFSEFLQGINRKSFQ
jgi:hypothetical protein